MSLFIYNAPQLVTVAGPDAARRGADQGKIAPISGGAVYCLDEKIVDAGPEAEVLKRHPEARRAHTLINAEGRAVIPGLVDCHSHPVFAGDRSDEYAMR